MRRNSAAPPRPPGPPRATAPHMDTSDENSKPGRKPVLDDAKRREICAILAIGGTRRMAAHYVGCSVDTVGRTALRDPAFADQIRKAEVGSEILFLRNLRAACQDAKQWRAATWALERFFPDRYGRRPPRTITRAELRELLRNLGLEIASGFPSAADRQRIVARLDQLVRTARRQAGRKRRTPKRKIEAQET
jgi:hypothetical protein